MSQWKQRPDGSIEAHPIVGWEAGSVFSAGLLRILYAVTPEEFGPKARPIQFALTAAQARLLAEDLEQMIRRIDAAAPKGERQ